MGKARLRHPLDCECISSYSFEDLEEDRGAVKKRYAFTLLQVAVVELHIEVNVSLVGLGGRHPPDQAAHLLTTSITSPPALGTSVRPQERYFKPRVHWNHKY